ncbi:MAG TPA: HAMP domain-containing sensor histidine kinase [Chloroflexota bacterium]|nr:HAMP domain-containing sensor histidine kinase [Chloroflexota bacterium]
MADQDQTSPSALLQQRYAVIVDRWYAAIARTSFTPRPATEVRAELRALLDRAIAPLLVQPGAEPPGEATVQEAGREVGATLARLRYVHHAALGEILSILGRELVAELPAEQAAALHPRLMALLGALAAGFSQQSNAMILEEQDQIRRALFVSRQEAEAAEQARAAAEAAARTRTEVLNIIAHDLRGPLTGIQGQADLMQRRLQRDTPPSPQWLGERVARVLAGATRMQTMVDELLDVARLQRGQELELRREPLDVGALVREVGRPRTSNAGGAAPIVVDAPDGLLVDGDRARLERVVDNLLANAIKYNRAAQPIEMTARRQGDAVTITIRDRGVGIPAGELPHLFTPFYRASTARGVPGIGLGLAGAKMIVEQHGGQITLESVEGQGTTVAIALPATSSGTTVEPAR